MKKIVLCLSVLAFANIAHSQDDQTQDSSGQNLTCEQIRQEIKRKSSFELTPCSDQQCEDQLEVELDALSDVYNAKGCHLSRQEQ